MEADIPDLLEHYRGHPLKFLSKPDEEEYEFLQKVVGDLNNHVYKAGDWPTSPFRDMSINEDDPEWWRLSAVLNKLEMEGDYQKMAVYMTFFRVEYYCFDDPDDFPPKWSKFKSVFPFGCFHYCNGGGESSGSSEEWARGHPSQDLLKLCLDSKAISNQEFETICTAMRNIRYTTSEIQYIVRQFYSDETYITKINPNFLERARIIVKMLSQNALLEDLDRPLLNYAYQSVDYPNEWFDRRLEVMRSDGIEFERPVWSRRNHLKISKPAFQKQALTVLCMQKYCRDEFPLHKDLIDTILGMVFDANLQQNDVGIKTMAERYQEYVELDILNYIETNTDRLMKFSLEHGVGDVRNFSILRAVQKSFGFPLSEDTADLLRTDLAYYIRTYASCKTVLDNLLMIQNMPRFAMSEPKYDRSSAAYLILNYCSKYGIPLFDLYKGTRVLTDVDLKIMVHDPDIQPSEDDKLRSTYVGQ
jgi:hypothetical protein